MAGQDVRIIAVLQDGDLKDRYHHSSAAFPGGWFHLGTDHYTKYQVQKPKADK